jgi:hypothetical protein
LPKTFNVPVESVVPVDEQPARRPNGVHALLGQCLMGSLHHQAAHKHWLGQVQVAHLGA